MTEKNGKRSKNWTVILYPESAPVNWKDIIESWHIEWIQSPLHDSDLNEADSELKKAHWHILLMFGGLKSYEQVKELVDEINSPSPQRCQNVKSLVRYMAHLDNPEKHQYDIADIKCFGGVDLASILKPSSAERYGIVKEMMEFVRDNQITEYQDLMDYAGSNRFDDWFPLLCDNSSLVMINYIKSLRHRGVPKKDFATGEVYDSE